MNMTTIRVSLKMFDMNTMEIVDKQVDLPVNTHAADVLMGRSHLGEREVLHTFENLLRSMSNLCGYTYEGYYGIEENF